MHQQVKEVNCSAWGTKVEIHTHFLLNNHMLYKNLSQGYEVIQFENRNTLISAHASHVTAHKCIRENGFNTPSTSAFGLRRTKFSLWLLRGERITLQVDSRPGRAWHQSDKTYFITSYLTLCVPVLICPKSSYIELFHLSFWKVLCLRL